MFFFIFFSVSVAGMVDDSVYIRLYKWLVW